VADLYHGAGAGESAEAEFDRMFRDHRPPAEVREFRLDEEHATDEGIRLSRVLTLAGLAASNREGARKIAEGGVRIDGEVVTDQDVAYTPSELAGRLVQVGRRAWVRIVE